MGGMLVAGSWRNLLQNGHNSPEFILLAGSETRGSKTFSIHPQAERRFRGSKIGWFRGLLEYDTAEVGYRNVEGSDDASRRDW